MSQVQQLLGAWSAALDLESNDWHVLIAPKLWQLLAIQWKDNVCQFMVLPYGLSITPRVFTITNMKKLVAQALSRQGFEALMYLNNWLVQASSCHEGGAHLNLLLSLTGDRGLLVSFVKSHLVPTQTIDWLCMKWDSHLVTLQLSPDNQRQVLTKVRCTLVAQKILQRVWESLLGSLNHTT